MNLELPHFPILLIKFNSFYFNETMINLCMNKDKFICLLYKMEISRKKNLVRKYIRKLCEVKKCSMTYRTIFQPQIVFQGCTYMKN